MNTKDLIELNNQKQKELSKENLKYYEDMLIYIRLSSDKSEQETEEILIELLDHLLEAQKAGRSAEDVFGEEPKKYVDEIIGELPRMVTKERMKFFAMIILYFLAASTIFSALFSVISHYLFNLGSLSREIYLGSFVMKTIFSILNAFLLLYFVLKYLRWTCFKKRNKIIEFLSLWLGGIVAVGLFMGLFYIIPDFGLVLEIPIYVVILLGIILYLAARMTRKSI